MSVEDRLAIGEMIAQYSYAYDRQDAEGFAQLFVEDGVLEVFVPGKITAAIPLQPQAAIRTWAIERLQARRGLLRVGTINLGHSLKRSPQTLQERGQWYS